MIHELKTWPKEFEAVAAGTKTHEARWDDRGYAVGDTLVLLEWSPHRPELCSFQPGESKLTGDYSGRRLHVEVTHVTKGEYGLPDRLAVMSIRLARSPDIDWYLEPGERTP